MPSLKTSTASTSLKAGAADLLAAQGLWARLERLLVDRPEIRLQFDKPDAPAVRRWVCALDAVIAANPQARGVEHRWQLSRAYTLRIGSLVRFGENSALVHRLNRRLQELLGGVDQPRFRAALIDAMRREGQLGRDNAPLTGGLSGSSGKTLIPPFALASSKWNSA